MADTNCPIGMSSQVDGTLVIPNVTCHVRGIGIGERGIKGWMVKNIEFFMDVINGPYFKQM